VFLYAILGTNFVPTFNDTVLLITKENKACKRLLRDYSTSHIDNCKKKRDDLHWINNAELLREHIMFISL